MSNLLLLLLFASAQEIPTVPSELNNCKSAWVYQDMLPIDPYVDPRPHYSDYVDSRNVVPDAADDGAAPTPDTKQLLTPHSSESL